MLRKRKCFTIFLSGAIMMFLIMSTKETTSNLKLISKSSSNRNVKSCGRFPQENDIFRDNALWQVLRMPKGLTKLYNAYLDMRMNKTVVRVTAISVDLNFTVDSMFCQFWFEGSTTPFVVKASEAHILWQRAWGLFKRCKLPYLITCPMNFDGELPTSVSLTSNPCDDAENRLKILDNQPSNGVKQKFGVCTKQLKYGGREFIVKFIEWVHMLRLLGVHKIHLNIAEVHPEMEKVLIYFEKQDFIEWVRYQDPSEIADHRMFSSQHRYLQMLILNDCFYRTKDLYDHIVLIDPDEIIIPLKEEDLTWNDIWNRLNSTYYDSDSISFANIYFPSLRDKPWPEIPSYDYMLQHVKRSKPELKPFMIHKSFFRPENILVVHNHRSFRCLKSKTLWCRGTKVPLEIAQLNHYRNTVKERFLNATIKDKTIWKYKNELVNAVEETLNKLNFQP